MNLSFNGYDVNCVTMLKDSISTNYQGVVKIDNAGCITKPSSGTEIYAVAVANRGAYATVQTRGYVELKYTGSTPTLGRTVLVADSNHGVCVNTSANVTPKTVLKVDTVNKIVGFIM